MPEYFEESPPLPFPSRAPASPPRCHSPCDRSTPRYNVTSRRNNVGYTVTRDGASSFVFLLITFIFFAAMATISVLYSPQTLRLGPNSSLLINPNRLFVDSVQVVDHGAAEGSMLYGFYKIPTLDVEVTWSETHKTKLPHSTHKEWVYYLNEGSQINISYSVDSRSSYVLVIAWGSEQLAKWLEDPSYPNATLSWNIINGNGTFKMDVLKSSTYYVAVGNMNVQSAKVELNMTIKAILFNTTEPYYKCAPAQGECIFELLLLDENAAVLISPCLNPGALGAEYSVKISYGHRWIAYLFSMGGLAVLLLATKYLMNNFLRTERATHSDQHEDRESDSDPLLTHDDNDDSLKKGSAHVSDSKDENHLCAICLDAPKNCFFVPCGHCAACFECATSIAVTSGICPICRQPMEKLSKIYTV